MKCLQATIAIICGGLCSTALWGQATNVFPSSGNVGIGTTTPTSNLQVVGSVSVTGSISSTGGFTSTSGGLSMTNGYVYTLSYGATPFIDFQTANGTQAAPTAVTAGQDLGHLGWFASDGSTGGAGGAGISASPSQNFTTSAHGTNLNFYTTPTNSNSYWQNYPARMTITGNGSVGVGTTTPGFQLDVQSGQINSSGGYCINGTNCITAWPTGGGGGGTVTSVTAGSGLSGGTITTSGTLSLNLANANAWTGAQSFGTNTNFPGGIWSSSGSVGIGTTAPTDLLMVNTSSNDVGITLRGAAASVSPAFKIANASGTVFSRIGIAGSAGNLVTGSSANDFVIRAENQNLFLTTNAGTSAAMTILKTGNVGIGTASPVHPLQVAGTIGAEEVIVSSTGADYVFDPNYHLAPLAEVADYINENHHLPGIPAATEMQAKGASVGDMQAKLLAKIEELTLHMIREHERNDRLEAQNQELREENRKIEEKVAHLEVGTARIQ